MKQKEKDTISGWEANQSGWGAILKRHDDDIIEAWAKKWKRSVGTASQIRVSVIQRDRLKGMCGERHGTYDQVLEALLNYWESSDFPEV